jgi:hypothetical protein
LSGTQAGHEQRVISLLLAAALAVCAQTPTTIGPHSMDETFHEWLTINNLDVAEVCQKHHQDKNVDYKAACKSLSAIRDTGTGQFSIVMGKRSSQPFSWWFVDGKAAQATARFETLEINQQIGFLSERYGPPATQKIVLGNILMFWNMPDGCTISLEQLDRYFIVTFFLPKYSQRLAEEVCRSWQKETH